MKRSILIVVLVVLLVFIYFRQENRNYYDLINAVSGATPLAVAKDLPAEWTLDVNGLVKKDYHFSGSALSGFAKSRIRTKEVDANGDFLGAYAYLGIPVFNILEGIAPQKAEDAAIDQPSDLIVSFKSSSGQIIQYSYNEILMVNDSLPVMLAYDRDPIEPSNEKAQETYAKNLFSEPLTGLRLIAPRDPDVNRYLDNVICITFELLSSPDELLPVRVNGTKCDSHSLVCIDGDQIQPAVLENALRIKNDNWIMIGHGRGYQQTSSVEGFDLASLLQNNFKDTQATDFFLFVACDGYRGVYSGYEIFKTEAGKKMIIVDQMNGEPSPNGLRLAPSDDYFVDRSIWAVSHIVRIRK